eukprot:8912395-Alexandrium_andersonii.AAC.1
MPACSAFASGGAAAPVTARLSTLYGLPSGLVTLPAGHCTAVRGPSGWNCLGSRCGCPMCHPRIGQCGGEGGIRVLGSDVA